MATKKILIKEIQKRNGSGKFLGTNFLNKIRKQDLEKALASIKK